MIGWFEDSFGFYCTWCTIEQLQSQSKLGGTNNGVFVFNRAWMNQGSFGARM